MTDLHDIIALFYDFSNAKTKALRIWEKLDAYDSGEFWADTAKTLPKHQILTDSNYVSIVKDAHLNSVYAGRYIADVIARNFEDDDMARKINAWLQFTYERLGLGYEQLLVGERAALLNVGAVQCGWNPASRGMDVMKRYKGDLEVRFLDPYSLYIDPEVKDYQKGQALFIAEIVQIATLRKGPYKEKLEEIIDKELKGQADPLHTFESGAHYGKPKDTSKIPLSKTVNLLTAYVRNDEGGLDRHYIINEKYLLDTKKNIKPDYFPVSILYSHPPTKDPYGRNSVFKILKNTFAINVLDSISTTHVYVSQRRPVIMRADVGLRRDDVLKNASNPDKVFVSNAPDLDRVLKFLDIADLPRNEETIRMRLLNTIYETSGVNPVYLGLQTNSATTTGGIDQIQSRAQMTDNTRIALLERYVIQLTKMIFDLHLENATTTREVALRHPTAPEFDEIFEIDFQELKRSQKVFDFSFEASPFLPRNRSRYAEGALQMLEMQMQYQPDGPQLITVEEALRYLDLPQKEMILQRIEMERMQNDEEQIQAELMSFSAMTQEGMSPEGAVQTLAEERRLQRSKPKTGNTQQRQKG